MSNNDIDVGALSEAINDKMDRDLNNRSDDSGLRKLVESYVNGTSWYKIFDEIQSNGTVKKWCEQGGYLSAGKTGSISFLKPYIQVAGVYFGCISTRQGRCYDKELYPNSVSNTGFSYTNTVSGGVGIYWFACGYIS